MRPPTVIKKKRASTMAVAGGDAATARQQLLKKGPWTVAEDLILKEYVRKHEKGNWNELPKNSGLQRCGKSCRLRWMNHLDPDLKKGPFTPDEEMTIVRLHAKFGNKWAHMAKHLPGRTDNKIKNYWNTRIKRREREGLPLYPPEIQQHISLRSHGQGQNAPWIASSLPALKTSQTTLSSFTSATPLLSENQYGSIVQDHNRGKNISFQFPYFTSPVQSGSENFDLGPPPYSVVELPSSQFSSNFGGEQMPQGNTGLLNDLLQESRREGRMLTSTCLAVDPLGKLGCWDFPLGIQAIEELLGTDAPALIDMMLRDMTAPTPMAVSPDWYNNRNNDGEFSNPPSSVTSDEDIGVDMHQLEWMPPMSPVEFDQGLGSCP